MLADEPLSRNQIAQALNACEPNWDEETSYLYGVGNGKKSISLEENLMFALLLLRSHQMEKVLRARDLIWRLLCFQIISPNPGFYPRFLHLFPISAPLKWQKWIASLLIFILKSQSQPCGLRLQKAIQSALQLLLTACETVKMKRRRFEDELFTLTSDWLENSKTGHKNASENFDYRDLDWRLGPENASIWLLFLFEFQPTNTFSSEKLRCWHRELKIWSGLLKRNYKGCNSPQNPIDTLLNQATWDHRWEDMEKNALLKSLIPFERADHLKALKESILENRCEKRFGRLIPQALGAVSLHNPLWACSYLSEPVGDKGDLARVWDLFRMIWKGQRSTGNCRLQVDAEQWVQKPQMTHFNANEMQLRLSFVTRSSFFEGSSPIRLICSHIKKAGWSINFNRTSVFLAGERFVYRDGSVDLLVQIGSKEERGQWIGCIRAVQSIENPGVIDHWQVFLKPLISIVNWKVDLTVKLTYDNSKI